MLYIKCGVLTQAPIEGVSAGDLAPKVEIMAKGKYIYGIIKGDGKVKFFTKGFFNKRPYAVTYNNISAVITDAPIKIYEQDQKGLLSHNRVLDEVIKNYTVLPMRFGTIARSEDEIKNLLRSAYPVLTNRLTGIKDKVEFDLEINIMNEQSILNDILEKHKEIKDLRNKLIGQGKDAKMEDKLLIGKMIAVEVSKYKNTLVKEIVIALKPYCSHCKSIGGINILANITFLVYKSKMNNFESAIYKLGDKYGDRLRFKYTGPLAPYNFIELKLILINFNTVDTARRQLGLGQEATIRDIKEAYRRLAQEYHPDKNPGDRLKEEEFKKIAGSYRLLCEYCRRYRKSRYYFKPEEIDEFSLLVEEE